ncbi:hypothetical protein SXCC_00577 [Gluconacetobacter sp. SXCC-1]|nr:hypothetical protein SXCC_00577 [Gluconacetobacter sp. SXCC-1]
MAQNRIAPPSRPAVEIAKFVAIVLLWTACCPTSSSIRARASSISGDTTLAIRCPSAPPFGAASAFSGD